jgi:hypothetical protein
MPPLRFHCLARMLESNPGQWLALAVRRSNHSARSHPRQLQMVTYRFRIRIRIQEGKNGPQKSRKSETLLTTGAEGAGLAVQGQQPDPGGAEGGRHPALQALTAPPRRVSHAW